MTCKSERRLLVLVGIFLTVGTLAVYWPVGSFDFTNYDDDTYVIQNPHVLKGITRDGLLWVWTSTTSSNWHPLTMLSHMLDCQLFGVNAGAHHWVNVIIHLMNTLLLFHLLRRMTGALWRSATVAALFAWHPLHVESVAWIAERKDVLCGFFWMLTLWAYLRYVERQGTGRYGLMLLLFALALMAKPMAVTLPFVLLLLDYWPLGRWRFSSESAPAKLQRAIQSQPAAPESWPRLVLEKLPLIALSGAASVVTFLVQKETGAMRLLSELSLPARLATAAVAYFRYLELTFWPRNLAVLYPHPGHWPATQVVLAVLCLIGISLFIWKAAGNRHWVVVGGLWFLGTLVPVIGLVQVGGQALADRYTYLPLTGVFIVVTWEATALALSRAWGKIAGAAVLVAALAGCLVITRLQLRHWKDSVALFTHALAVTQNNAPAHYNLAKALYHRGRYAEAIEHCRETLRLQPVHLLALTDLGGLLLREGKVQEATEILSEAVRLFPAFATAQYNLGLALDAQGRAREAISHLRQAVRLSNSPLYQEKLAWILATNPQPECRNGQEAVQLAERACQTTSNQEADALLSLAVAYGETRRFGEAVAMARKALDLSSRSEPPATVARMSQVLQVLQTGHPYREYR